MGKSMIIAYENVYQRIRDWAELQGIQVRESQMPAGNAGEFNGLSVTMNSTYDPQERAYYLIHALGSMVRWSLDKVAVQGMFDELSAAKNHKADLDRLEAAIVRYRAFEAESSAFAVWLLAELGCPDAVPSYTNFMRADLESMTEFHRHGRAPVWRIFFARSSVMKCPLVKIWK